MAIENPISQFMQAIEAAGLGSPAINPDGELHRFHVEEDKPGSLNGWYLLHLDSVPAGAFGSWKAGFQQTWCAKSRNEMSHKERENLSRLLEQAKQKRQQQQQNTWAEGAAIARKRWEAAAPCIDYPYLTRKVVASYGLRVDRAGSLLIPIYHNDELCSLQIINANGCKRFLKSGKIAGAYFTIGKIKGAASLLICEGYATGVTLHQESRLPVVVAFNAGNLKPVALAVHSRHPSTKIIIAGDNDHSTKSNPGRAAAIEAARAIGGKWVVPDFTGLQVKPKDTDFNDLARLVAGRVAA